MKFLKFLGARRFGLRTATRFLNFTPASRNGFEILKFVPELSDGFEISKFALASARLTDTAQNFISRNGFKILKLICEPLRAPRRTLPSADKAEIGRAVRLTSQHMHDAIEKRRAVKFNHAGGYLNSMRRRIARLRSAAARHGYEVGRAEKLSKFDLTGALLNFISLPPRKFKLALLKFTPEPSHSRSEILNFTPAVRKFKPAPAVRLNFALNSIPHASAAKFENGVKFKAAAKFERGAR